ncbi:nucleotide disphospho-sugar-binding domain-containing protein [Rapidithrix thailandica]|uniref:Nucleotide disphospho-sugar-binding domain-containing protein n=1 Tax=Rapidithrix thailandica TaxID=413964 RepID=A0AAW9S3D9_9BACT
MEPFLAIGELLKAKGHQVICLLSEQFRYLAGGLVKPEEYNNRLFHFVPEVPYHWMFPRVYGVIHHGGAGTTHLALKYGCVNLIIPHIIDQFVWNSRIRQLGVGSKGMNIHQVNRKRLEPKILELIHTAAFKENAKKIAIQMKKEDFCEVLYRAIVE